MMMADNLDNCKSSKELGETLICDGKTSFTILQFHVIL